MNFEEKRDFFEINIDNAQTAFDNSNPLHLEIGSGRGEFIYNKALQNPNVNFFAVDVKEKRIKTIIRRLDENLHKNVKVIKVFIDSETIKKFPKDKIEKIYLLFPDPWPKKKHHRRRIIQSNFIDNLNILLKVNGVLEITTDHQGYAMWIKEHFDERNDFEPIYKEKYLRNPQKNHIITYFEEKKRAEGYIPYYFFYKKIKNLEEL